MEIIRLEGYTEDEKVEIAQRHLIAKQIEAHGLKNGEFELTEDGLRDLIRYYTREAGVRTLEREIARLARKTLRQILEKKVTSVTVTPENLGDFAGVRKFRHGMSEEEAQVGAVTGLAWTEVGGELLTIESVTTPGKGEIKTTGKLGEVMTESDRRGVQLRQGAGAGLWHQAVDLPAQEHPHPLARRRGAQGRAERRRRHGHLDRLDADRHPGAARRGDDRRGHAARPGAADRRAQGKAARGAARRHQDGADPRGEREGPRGDSRQRQATGWKSSRWRMSTRCWATR